MSLSKRPRAHAHPLAVIGTCVAVLAATALTGGPASADVTADAPSGATRLFRADTELWKTDPWAGPTPIARLGDNWLFRADHELWKTDGTPAGTTVVKDTKLWKDHTSLFAATRLGTVVLFAANDGIHGPELWRTDGTAKGTRLVKDINPGPSGSHLDDLTAVGSRVYFAAGDGIHGVELWKTDGSAAGTVLVKNIRKGGTRCHDGECISGGGSGPTELTALGTSVVFSADGGAGREPWVSDGTTAGTVQLKNIRKGFGLGSGPGHLTRVGAKVFFSALGVYGNELYVTDGTPVGTHLTRNIRSPGGSSPEWPVAFNDNVYFAAHGSQGNELWRSDGTELGTVLVKNILLGGQSFPRELTIAGGQLFFSAATSTLPVYDDRELWVSDGTTDGTRLAKDANPAGYAWSPRHLLAVGADVYFSAGDQQSGRQLWRSDGTADGTQLAADLTTGSPASSNPVPWGVAGMTLLFQSTDPDRRHPRELWGLPLG